ncbi:hypothetical protein [Capsulimonas corticalis]|uniref:hypothetical protein n=1 Tax=Capsulimonas corticalis TaxID=2219043 RepID=UPI000FFA0543|nr:hypothetical protein [Capsulimonas corticalis]
MTVGLPCITCGEETATCNDDYCGRCGKRLKDVSQVSNSADGRAFRSPLQRVVLLIQSIFLR